MFVFYKLKYVLDKTLYMWFFPTYITDRYDETEMLLKVAVTTHRLQVIATLLNEDLLFGKGSLWS